MIIRVLEIGVAVIDLAQSAQEITLILGGCKGKSIAAPEYQMTAQMVRVGNIEFELMEPLNQKGLIKKFISQRGQGLHHIALQVDDIAQTVIELRQRGIKTINAEPLHTHGMKAVFLQPDSLCGVLFELIEGSPRWIGNRPLPSELQSPVSGNGLEAEGLLSIGIMVEDVATAAEIYSDAFNANPSKTMIPDGKAPENIICRVGNIDIMLMQIPRKKTGSNPVFSTKRPGLHHIVVKVKDLSRSLAFLKNHRIDFESDRRLSADPIRAIALNPEQFSGVPILLKDSKL